jgi:integral membrane protein
VISLELFRRIAVVEGVTTLALFFVAMPMKYLAGDARLVWPLGMIHGIAFIVYMIAMVAAFFGRRLGTTAWVRTTIASLFPFGTFINDSYIKSLEKQTGSGEVRSWK